MPEYIDQLNDLFNGSNWTAVSFWQAIQETDFNQAIKKKLNNRHSVYEILYHSLAWRIFLLNALELIEKESKELSLPKQWPENVDRLPDDWEQLKDQFFVVNQKLINLFEKKGDCILSEKVPNRSYTFKYLINGIIQHDYYHMGQISLLR